MTSVDIWILDQRSNTYDDHQTSKFVSQDAEQQYYDMYEKRKQQNNRHLSYHKHQVNDNTCGMQRHDLNAVTSTKSKVLKQLKIFPQLVKNSINGVIYDMKHYDEIPEPQNQSRVEYILTRDSRAPYLFSAVIGIVFIALLVACIANCCRDPPPIVTGVPFGGYNQPPFPQSFVPQQSLVSAETYNTFHPSKGKVQAASY